MDKKHRGPRWVLPIVFVGVAAYLIAYAANEGNLFVAALLTVPIVLNVGMAMHILAKRKSP